MERESDEEVDGCDVARVELGVSGDQLVPELLTSMTQLEPSRAWRKGEPYKSKAGPRRHGNTLWVITFESTDVETSALELLHRVEPVVDALRRCANDADATISVGIWWEPHGGQGGFTVSSDVLRRLANLGERIDLYFPG